MTPLDRHLSREDIQVANKHMQRYSTSLVVWKMDWKTTTRCHFTPTRTAIINTRENNTCWWAWRETGALLCGWWEWNMGQLPWETFRSHGVTMWPGNATLGIHPREKKVYVHAKTCPQVFMAALLTLAKKEKHPKCLSTDEWINKLWCIHTGLLFSHKKECSADTDNRSGLQHMLSGRSQLPKATYYMIPLIGNVQNRRIHRDRKYRFVVLGSWRRGMGSDC